MPPSVKMLIPVWGEAYVDRFATLALPALLAPGNLPALAASSEARVVMLTTPGGMAFLERYPAFAELRRICPVEFLAIDDLIASTAYGVTLTLAFMRGIAQTGAAMTQTHFVFLNSDFILADGSLGSLAKRILAGRRCIMAPSFRAIAEEVEPVLRKAVAAGGGHLIMSPRDMVALALRHLHPTTIAKTVNQNHCHSIHTNQLYWSVDRDTMLGRMFLVFMLCIRPERVITRINSFCDYGFVPELCPSGDIDVVEDSDEVFILEAQDKLQEGGHIRLGAPETASIGDGLAEWTTAGHRRMGTHDLVFHAKELPPDLGQVRAQADAYVRTLLARLPPPKSHVFHPYWTGGLAAWAEQRQQAGQAANPPEAARAASSEWFGSRHVNRARQALLGARPFVRLCHPDWLDYRSAARAISATLETGKAATLLVRDRQTAIEGLLPPRDSRFKQASLRAAAAVGFQDAAESSLGAVICVITPQNLRSLEAGAIAALLDLLERDGELLLIFHNIGADAEWADVTLELTRLIVELPAERFECRSTVFNGGLAHNLIWRGLHALQRMYVRHGPLALALVVPAALGLLLLSTLNNLRRISGAGGAGEFISSAALRLRKR